MSRKNRTRKSSYGSPAAISSQQKSWAAQVLKGFDSYINPALSLGLGGGNALELGGFTDSVNQNFNWLKLRYMYSGNWIARRLIEMQAEDMTREGIQITGEIDPDEMKKIYADWDALRIQRKLYEGICMARLYGGSIVYIDIEGQDPSTPLDLNTIGKGKFRGLKVFDRWQLWPSVDDYNPDDNMPNLYTALTYFDSGVKFNSSNDLNKLKDYTTDFVMHRSRVIRCDGDYLPYIDFLQNQRWYASVLVNAMDVITSYVTASAALASASYKSSFRVVKLDRMYEVLNQGTSGQSLQNLTNFLQVMKLTESTENITALDSGDSIEILNYDLGGLMQALDQFERQLSSLSGAPATKLLGETAKGLNATGDNETRMYYDKIKHEQESMRPDILKLLQVAYISTTGKQPPEDLNFQFTPLWQMDPDEKASIAKSITETVNEVYESGLVTRDVAIKELLQSSDDTGIWTNISSEDIEKAEQEEDDPPEPALIAPPANIFQPPEPGKTDESDNDENPDEKEQNREPAA